ncbi:hypothetical protein [Geoanaerobacter pelophilus]|uniref:hypothetical protein n=1 Tax=Geoanaerobacter pelophilus TaxID=60036 RepID=UPI00117BBAE1|nr:hypothetical protein [Geoanaerobacter pelophilus]
MSLRKSRMVFLVSAAMAIPLVAGCSSTKREYKVGVVGFQQCRPDLVLKETGYNDIETKNEAGRCNKRGMPVIFAAELAGGIEKQLKKKVVVVPLDVPYNYNIRSQIDIARREGLDYLVGGKLDSYIDPAAVDRAKRAGILANTAILSPTPSAIPDDAETVLKTDLKLARVSDGKILSEYREEEQGSKAGDYYTRELAEKIADRIEDFE